MTCFFLVIFYLDFFVLFVVIEVSAGQSSPLDNYTISLNACGTQAGGSLGVAVVTSRT
jgi:hypothetical protein